MEKIKGTDEAKLLKMNEISMLNLKVVRERSVSYIGYDDDFKKPIQGPESVLNIAINALAIHEQDIESFYIYTLDTKNKITGIFEVSRGSLNASIVHPREVFKRAILHNANSIILLHNHPSGDAKPSNEDLNITKRLQEAGDLLGIKILDHIIIGDENNYISFKEKKLI